MNKKYPFLISLMLFSLVGGAKAVSPSDFGLKEGDLISAIFSDDPDVYIINEYGFKRLFLNPEIFRFYGHLGGFANVKLVTPEIRDSFPISGLFRNCEDNDEKVYGIEIGGEDKGQLRWVNSTGEQAVQDDPDFFKKVFCINKKEFDWYKKAGEFNTAKDVPEYERFKGREETTTEEKLKTNIEFKETGRVLICHYPAETADRPQEILIAPPSVKAHLAHGDQLGACPGTTPPLPIPSVTPSIPASLSFSPTPTPTPTPTPSSQTPSIPSVTVTPTPISPTTTPSPTASISYYPTPTPTTSPVSSGSPPVLSNMQRVNITTNSVTITWVTDKPSDSTVRYGTNYKDMNSRKNDSALVINHSITIDGLSSGTGYAFQYASKDSSGNVGGFIQDWDPSAAYFTYSWVTTLATPSPTPTPTPTITSSGSCTGFILTLDKTTIAFGSPGEQANFTFSCTSGQVSLVRIEFANSDGTTRSRFGDVSASTTPTTYGFRLGYPVGSYALRACFNPDYYLGCTSVAIAASVPFYVTSASSPTPTPTPSTASVSFDNFSRNLTIGSTGDDVKRLQALLVNEVGYPANLLTGYFGNITRDAVKRLQKKYGVRPISGYFGKITRKALGALLSNQ